MPTTTLNRSFSYILLWSSLLVSLSAGYLSFWTDSEMWPVSATKYFFSTRTEYYFGTKPLFHFGLFLNERLALWLGAHPMDTARAFMILNLLGILAAVFMIVNKVSKNKIFAALSVSFLLSLSIIVKRSVEVRSDLIVSHIFLWLLYFEVAKSKKWHSFLFASATGFLVSPKTILWMLASLPFVQRFQFPKNRKTIFILLLGSCLVLVASYFTPFLSKFILDPLGFLRNSLYLREVGVGYFSVARLQHVIRFFTENPHAVVIYIAVTVSTLRNKQRTKLESQMLWMGLILVGLLIVYPDRLPFLIAAIMPFLVLQICTSPKIYGLLAERTPRQIQMRMLISGLCLLSTIHWARVTVGTHSNQAQREIAFWFRQELTKLPSLEIFDPVGIIPGYEANYWFLGPGQAAKNQFVINYLREKKPEVILYVQKSEYLEPQLSTQLIRNYAGDGAGIHIRRTEVLLYNGSIGTQTVIKQLREEFPRLSGKAEIIWLVTFTTLEGFTQTQKLTWQYLEEKPRLQFPKRVETAIFQPFELKLPFSTNLSDEFRFDWEF